MLFKAALMICLIARPDACFIADDTRGPYESIAVCSDRLADMIVTIENDETIGAIHYVRGARCEVDTTTKHKTSILSNLKVLGHGTP